MKPSGRILKCIFLSKLHSSCLATHYSFPPSMLLTHLLRNNICLSTLGILWATAMVSSIFAAVPYPSFPSMYTLMWQFAHIAMYNTHRILCTSATYLSYIKPGVKLWLEIENSAIRNDRAWPVWNNKQTPILSCLDMDPSQIWTYNILHASGALCDWALWGKQQVGWNCILNCRTHRRLVERNKKKSFSRSCIIENRVLLIHTLVCTFVMQVKKEIGGVCLDWAKANYTTHALLTEL